MGDVTFRPGRPADAERLAEYHHRCWLEAFADLFEPGVVAALDPRRRVPVFELWLSPEATETTVVVAELDGVAVGHLVVFQHEVAHVFVDPERWGRGIGRQLLARAEAQVAANGFTTAELHTMVGNEPALALYRSAGWRLTDDLAPMDDGDLRWQEHVLRTDLSTGT